MCVICKLISVSECDYKSQISAVKIINTVMNVRQYFLIVTAYQTTKIEHERLESNPFIPLTDPYLNMDRFIVIGYADHNQCII